jgi:hypothetical protein
MKCWNSIADSSGNIIFLWRVRAQNVCTPPKFANSLHHAFFPALNTFVKMSNSDWLASESDPTKTSRDEVKQKQNLGYGRIR